MKRYVVVYEHRFGMDIHVVESSRKLTVTDIENWLEEFEPGRDDEYITLQEIKEVEHIQ